MAFTITDNGNTITVNDGVNNSSINKPFDVTANSVNNSVIIKSELEIVTLKFTSVTSPVTSDIYALRDLLDSYNNTSTAPLLIGSATSANQTTEIAKLTSLDSKAVQQTLQGDALKVYVTNQIDLTTVQNSLASILTSVQNIDLNTDTVETKLQTIITNLATYSTLNHTDLLSVVTELQGIDANTDLLEIQLASLITNTTGTATSANQATQISNFGAQADAVATSDTGTFSLIALFKRLLGGWKIKSTVSSSTDRGIPAWGVINVNDLQYGGAAAADGAFTPISLDTYGRIRVEEAARVKTNDFSYRIDKVLRTPSKTLGDYKFTEDLLPDLFTFSGTGTSAFSTNKCAMSVTAGQFTVGQSTRKHLYVGGNPQLVEFTVDNFHTQANVTKEIGYYDDSITSPFTGALDGFRLYNDGTDFRFQIYKGNTAVYNVVSTAFDNASVLTGYDFTNFTVFAIDFLYLGGAGARLFMFKDGEFKLLHTIKYAGTATGTFITYPNKPMRFALRSTTGTGAFNVYCSKIATEGEISESIARTKSVHSGTTGFTAATVGTTYAIIGLKLKTTNLASIVKIVRGLSFITTADEALFTLMLNPTVAGTFTYTDITNAPVQRAIGATTNTVTGGTMLPMNYGGQSQSIELSDDDLLLQLGSSVAGVRDEIVLCITPMSANITVFGGIEYKQF